MNSAFTKEELAFITRQFGKNQAASTIRRAFRVKFCPKNPRNVPKVRAFSRVIARLQDNGSAHPRPAPGKEEISVDTVESVRNFFMENERSNIREASSRLNLSIGTVWKILRKNLKWKAFKPHKVQVLSAANRLARMSACEYWLTFPETWFERVIWTDEKWFVLRSPPHSQNDRYWAPVHRHEVVECKKAHGEKMMAWVGIVDGRCLPVVWFTGSVNGDVYLNQVLKATVWPALRSIATRRQYWFQQDGASCHVTTPCLEFLREKFGDRIISRNTDHHWPPYSPDLSPLDFSFWNQVMINVKKRQPSNIEELKNIVEEFASGVSEEFLRKIARHTRKRAALCVQEQGGHFEHLL